MNMFKFGDIVRDPYTRGLYRVVRVEPYYVEVVSLCKIPHRHGTHASYGWQLVK